MKITVIGCGRWGTFIAWYLDKIGHNVTLYGRESSKNMRELIESRSNGLITLNESLLLSTNLKDIEQSEIIVISINSQGLQKLENKYEVELPICNAVYEVLYNEKDAKKY